MESIREVATIALEDDTQIAVARRAAASFGARLGLSADAVARAELVAVELAANVLRHATRGFIYLSSVVEGPGTQPGLQLITTDKGPGIGNVALAMEDGFSTSTTPGLGLGAVRRMVQEFGIYSQLGAGTVISAVIGEDRADHAHACAVLSTCITGETLNGDSWLLHCSDKRRVYVVVDGLGHGLYASEASGMAVKMVAGALATNPELTLTDLLTRMHEPMKATRGAAIALVSVTDQANVATCCGVGNIIVQLHGADGAVQSVMSHNGTLGHQMRRVQEFTYPLPAGTTLVMHSDGIATHWKMAGYPGLLAQPPATVAGVLYRDAVRGRDDATVLVAKLKALA
jgi:anti-sigma regulatory factor (Ser/Thr protein kinase)